MNILLVRPDPGNERFGLGPFFRIEPLGLEYLAQALLDQGHNPLIVDLRFGRGLSYWMSKHRPRVVGISCAHALEYDEVLALARQVRRLSPDTFVLVGGHAAGIFPEPLEHDAVDAICVDDGEEVLPALIAALETGEPLSAVPALRLRTADGFVNTPPLTQRPCLDKIPLPNRGLVKRYRNQYLCLLFKPVWLIETARGCPYRCSFCSVWQFYDRSFRERSLGAVVDDFASTGPHIFLADDLFWNHPERSLELAHALRKRGIKKEWILAQSRCDLVARNDELLRAWRPLAKHFDIFFGMEAVSNDGLANISKDAELGSTVDAIGTARDNKFGVIGNFLVDPDWDEPRFEQLWDFVETHALQRSGFTLLTPLPGTELFDKNLERLRGQPWYKYDMHHLLWEPRLGAQRFFELYAETWRRSVLNLNGKKSWKHWARQVRLRHLPTLTRVLWRTQRLMKPEAYMREHSG